MVYSIPKTKKINTFPVAVFSTEFGTASAQLATTSMSRLPRPKINPSVVTVVSSPIARDAIVSPVSILILPMMPPVTLIFQSTSVASASPTFFITALTFPIPPVISPISNVGCAGAPPT